MITNIIIFGTGLFYARRKNVLPLQTKIIGFIDNDINIQGKCVDGALVYAPGEIANLDYDLIILASLKSREMKEQLLMLNVPEEKIMFWEEFISSKTHGVIEKYEIENINNIKGKEKVLIIVPIINYAGGFLTSLYAALALKRKNYCVVIVSPIANNITIQEVNSLGISVWICPSLPYVEEVELHWIRDFDFVIANSLQNMLCVERISKEKNVAWWLHEHSRQYHDITAQYGKDLSLDKNIDLYAVSNIARKNFIELYKNKKIELLPFGLPDFYAEKGVLHEKIVIAIIGNISNLKNQKELVQAIKKLPKCKQEKIQCWIIGRDGEKNYRKELEKSIENTSNIIIRGEMTRKEIEKVFGEIDVVVCTSLEETMSITIVEGMMNKKICITNSNTGVAEFTNTGVNGFIYEMANEDELREKIEYIIDNFEHMDNIRNAARDTYEKYFTIDVFGNNLEKILKGK